MREHMGLYRGKRIDNGEWVEGWLVFKKDPLLEITYCFILSQGKGESFVTWYCVDPDTVGECTGLTDKNGKLIFEGDIVKATIVRDMGGGETTREEQGVIGYDSIGMLGLINHFYKGKPVWTDFFFELSLSGLISEYCFEIISNIHDNPELLKGGEG